MLLPALVAIALAPAAWADCPPVTADDGCSEISRTFEALPRRAEGTQGSRWVRAFWYDSSTRIAFFTTVQSELVATLDGNVRGRLGWDASEPAWFRHEVGTIATDSLLQERLELSSFPIVPIEYARTEIIDLSSFVEHVAESHLVADRLSFGFTTTPPPFPSDAEAASATPRIVPVQATTPTTVQVDLALADEPGAPDFDGSAIMLLQPELGLVASPWDLDVTYLGTIRDGDRLRAPNPLDHLGVHLRASYELHAFLGYRIKLSVHGTFRYPTGEVFDVDLDTEELFEFGTMTPAPPDHPELAVLPTQIELRDLDHGLPLAELPVAPEVLEAGDGTRQVDVSVANVGLGVLDARLELLRDGVVLDDAQVTVAAGETAQVSWEAVEPADAPTSTDLLRITSNDPFRPVIET
ncbi:MAG: hypothetical protein KC656_21945, partial [Myxococcales bacterium]|nr:hypothetical protein [Myxococcales bacterium]